MRKNLFHWLVPLSLCVTMALPLCQAVAQTADYTSLISQTTEALKNNNAEQAFQKALAAIAANPTGHEGYFYAGVAAYRQDLLDAAEKYVRQALERAPEDAKPLYQDTLKAIAEKKLFLAHVEAGQKAEEDGLFAKAAREYTTAWDAFPMRTEVGLKAAALWANRLQSPGQAARILNTILAQTSDEKVKQQANALLAPLQAAIQAFYAEKLKAGESALAQGQMDEAYKAAMDASLAQPTAREAHLLLARIYAHNKEVANVTKELTKMLQSGPVQSDFLLRQPEFLAILANSDFQAWLNDAIGPEAVSQAKLIIEDNRAVAKRLEEEIAKLTQEKDLALSNMRKELFCLQCMRSSTEIEKLGESFKKHLQDTASKGVQATPKQLAEKAKEFDDKILAKQQELAKLNNALQGK